MSIIIILGTFHGMSLFGFELIKSFGQKERSLFSDLEATLPKLYYVWLNN
ncbi:MAG: hypothetical protein MGU50_06715 [Trichodesmium sp. MAG_R02]|nr:hypothetical protein [Trichodesmium sp. MAG_R02]